MAKLVRMWPLGTSRTPWSKTVLVLQFNWEKVSTSFKNSVYKELFCILLWNRMMKCLHDILLCKGEKNMWNLLHKGLTVLHLKSRYTSPVVSHLNSPNNTKRDCCRLQAVYSPIKIKNSVTVYTAFNPWNRGNLLLRLQEKVLVQY